LNDSATELLYESIRCVMNGQYWIGREAVTDLMAVLRDMKLSQDVVSTKRNVHSSGELFPETGDEQTLARDHRTANDLIQIRTGGVPPGARKPRVCREPAQAEPRVRSDTESCRARR
jgi:hypothetical protein